jgi:hypothetical protein
MKATELRIGNYYIGCSRQEIEVVNGKTIEQFESGVLPCMKPIPLTEEWLVKFGFKNIYGRTYYYKKLKFDINTLGKIRFYYSGKIVYLEHVHQLQNLYFALMGEELTIKE